MTTAILLMDHGSRVAAANQAVFLVGNAPTALFELLALARAGQARPSLVVGVPVGFVGAAESKEALPVSGLPFITCLDAVLTKRLEWAHTARELYLELGPHHPLLALVAARVIDRLQEWAPGVRCGVLLAGYAGEPAVTFGELS